MKNRRTRLALILLLVAFIFGVLSLLFWNVVRDTIALPIYYLIWIIDLVLRSISQSVYLAFLVLIGIIIGIDTLLRAERRPIYREYNQSQPPMTRYHYWKTLCSGVTYSRFSREMFATESRRLLLSILAHQEGKDVSDVEDRIRQGTLSVPEPIRELVQHKEIWGSHPGENTFLRRLFRPAAQRVNPQAERQMAEIIGFIEYLLEISYAGNQPESQS